MSVNGYSLVNVDHYTAVEVLREAGATIILRVVRDDPKNSTFNRVSAYKIFCYWFKCQIRCKNDHGPKFSGSPPLSNYCWNFQTALSVEVCLSEISQVLESVFKILDKKKLSKMYKEIFLLYTWAAVRLNHSLIILLESSLYVEYARGRQFWNGEEMDLTDFKKLSLTNICL